MEDKENMIEMIFSKINSMKVLLKEISESDLIKNNEELFHGANSCYIQIELFNGDLIDINESRKNN